MQHFYVNDNAQDNGDHEVHTDTCSWLPDVTNRTYLGYYASCTQAVAEAKLQYPQSNGCIHCSLACHTS